MNRVSAKWRKFGFRIGLERNQMENYWARERDNDACWEKVMEAWLKGQGQHLYPPTWEGLYEILEDVELGGVVSALKEAVASL